MKPDITTIDDIEKLVRMHYSQLLEDADTSPKFADLDLDAHFPHVFGFWEMVILSKPMAYMRNAFEPHTRLGLQKIHFEKWLQFFNTALDYYFEGPNTEKARAHAKLMAAIFESKLLK